MIKFFTLGDLEKSCNLSHDRLKYWLKTGRLEYIRLPLHFGGPKDIWTFLIPESELPKLAKYKVSEPVPNDKHQPEVLMTFERDGRSTCKPRYYHQHIHSKKWQQVKDYVFERDGYRCRMCGSAMNLQGHHVSYERLGEDRERDDVITLCRDCHEMIHSRDIFSEGVVSIPLNIVDKVTDFIFNSALLAKEQHPDIFLRWECERIDELAHYFQFFVNQKGEENDK